MPFERHGSTNSILSLIYRNFATIAPIATKKASPIPLFVSKPELAGETDAEKEPSNSITTITPNIPVANTVISVFMFYSSFTYSLFAFLNLSFETEFHKFRQNVII